MHFASCTWLSVALPRGLCYPTKGLDMIQEIHDIRSDTTKEIEQLGREREREREIEPRRCMTCHRSMCRRHDEGLFGIPLGAHVRQVEPPCG